MFNPERDKEAFVGDVFSFIMGRVFKTNHLSDFYIPQVLLSCVYLCFFTLLPFQKQHEKWDLLVSIFASLLVSAVKRSREKMLKRPCQCPDLQQTMI